MPHLTRLKNRHVGERVVLVANGPSLNSMDLSFLKSQTVIGMNKIFLGFKRFCFYPKYFVAVNRKVIEQSQDDIKRLNCVKVIGSRGADLFQDGGLTYVVNTQQPAARFCKHPDSEGFHEGWTVTYVALQLAYFLGFSEVVVIGMDHRFEYSGLPNESAMMGAADANHFSADYFAGQQWDNPDLVRSEESYTLARQVFEAEGRRIVDATLGGACTVFEKGNYRDIFFR